VLPPAPPAVMDPSIQNVSTEDVAPRARSPVYSSRASRRNGTYFPRLSIFREASNTESAYEIAISPATSCSSLGSCELESDVEPQVIVARYRAARATTTYLQGTTSPSSFDDSPLATISFKCPSVLDSPPLPSPKGLTFRQPQVEGLSIAVSSV
jgi:hypothetical protein